MEYGYSKDIAAMHKFRQDARSPVIGGAYPTVTPA